VIGMNQKRWQQIESLYHNAREYPVSERTIFLREACAGDLSLLQEIETLLREETKAVGFLATPAMHVAAKLLAGEETSDQVPRTIGGYEILSRLGGGGMGVVYLASDLILQRRIAVKVLRPEILHHREARARFPCEARAVAALSHSGIVKHL
jgi:eukaryotic-like serine/threonine-protein kinase